MKNSPRHKECIPQVTRFAAVSDLPEIAKCSEEGCDALELAFPDQIASILGMALEKGGSGSLLQLSRSVNDTGFKLKRLSPV